MSESAPIPVLLELMFGEAGVGYAERRLPHGDRKTSRRFTRTPVDVSGSQVENMETKNRGDCQRKREFTAERSWSKRKSGNIIGCMYGWECSKNESNPESRYSSWH
jgi:hypothetical protein